MSLLWQLGHSSAVIKRVSSASLCGLVAPGCPFGAPRFFPGWCGRMAGLRCGCAEGGVFGFLYLRSSRFNFSLSFFEKNDFNFFADPFDRHIYAAAVAAFIDLFLKHLITTQLNFCLSHLISYNVAN